MKKNILKSALILIFIFLFSPLVLIFAAPASKPPPCDSYGDLNSDGFLTDEDKTLMAKWCILKAPGCTPEQLRRADVNDDGEANMGDLILLGRYILGLEKTFPVCIPKPDTASSAGIVPCGRSADDLHTEVNEQAQCAFSHFFVLFKNILDFLIAPPGGLIWLIAVGLIAFGGFMYIIGRGEGKVLGVANAREIITSAIIGLVIVSASWIAINTLFSLIGPQAWTGIKTGWWRFDAGAVCLTPPKARMPMIKLHTWIADELKAYGYTDDDFKAKGVCYGIK